MTQPAGPIIGAAHLDDGINTRFRWNEESGLASPASRAVGSIQQTFGGPVRVVPTPVTYPPKDLDLPGYLLQVNGLAEGYDRLDRLYNLAGTAGSVSILQMGALGLEVIPETPIVERLKAHRVQLDFSMNGTAIPATWTALFGSYLGSAYGMVANGESLINTSAFALAAGASPSVTNAGSAPTPIVLTISVSGPRTTRFYVRCTAPGYTKRISVTPVSGGVVSIGEKDGLFVPPGASVLRYEEASGALITGTIASSIYGTRWRYEGLDESLSEVGPVVVYNTRQQRAYAATSAFTTSAGLTLYGPDVPRFGNSGTYDATDAGLVVEPDRTNLCLQSQAIGTSPWVNYSTAPTITADATTAPDGTTTADQMTQATAATLSGRSQSITVVAGSVYVLSVYVRSGPTYGNVTLRLRVEDGAGGGIINYDFTSSANWTRHEVLFTATTTTAVVFIRNGTGGNQMDAYWWGVQVELANGQTAANATSYIPTTTTTQRRYGDILGVRPVENLLAWSNRFDKQTASSTARGLWYVAGGTITTSPRQAGPSGVTDAATLTAAGAVAGIQQQILNCENLHNKTIVFSVWVKNSVSTPDGDFFLRISEVGGTGSGSQDHVIANLDDQWRRITVQRKLTNPTDVSLHIRTTGAITVYFAHAHAYVGSDGTYNLTSVSGTAVSAPYIETQANPVYRARGWEWPDWLTQNGYIEADICFGETANPNSVTRMYLGALNSYFSPSIWGPSLYRSASVGSAANNINVAMQNNAGTSSTTYVPSSSLYDGAYHKYRVEWVNYTVSGTRTIRLRLYLDGVEVASATTGGATSWLRVPTLLLGAAPNGGEIGWSTMKNIAIGSPVLPANAVPAPY